MFPCCSTREDLSIDVTIPNVELILTKLKQGTHYQYLLTVFLLTVTGIDSIEFRLSIRYRHYFLQYLRRLRGKRYIIHDQYDAANNVSRLKTDFNDVKKKFTDLKLRSQYF